MASLTWLIKNQFHWDDLALSLMGDAGSVIPVLSVHLQGKGTCLECRFPQNWKLLKILGFLKPSLPWQTHSRHEQQPLSLAPSRLSPAKRFLGWFWGFVFGVLMWWCCWVGFVCFFSQRKTPNQKLFAECALVLSVFHKKKFLYMGDG